MTFCNIFLDGRYYHFHVFSYFFSPLCSESVQIFCKPLVQTLVVTVCVWLWQVTKARRWPGLYSHMVMSMYIGVTWVSNGLAGPWASSSLNNNKASTLVSEMWSRLFQVSGVQSSLFTVQCSFTINRVAITRSMNKNRRGLRHQNWIQMGPHICLQFIKRLLHEYSTQLGDISLRTRLYTTCKWGQRLTGAWPVNTAKPPVIISPLNYTLFTLFLKRPALKQCHVVDALPGQRIHRRPLYAETWFITKPLPCLCLLICLITNPLQCFSVGGNELASAGCPYNRRGKVLSCRHWHWESMTIRRWLRWMGSAWDWAKAPNHDTTIFTRQQNTKLSNWCLITTKKNYIPAITEDRYYWIRYYWITIVPTTIKSNGSFEVTSFKTNKYRSDINEKEHWDCRDVSCCNTRPHVAKLNILFPSNSYFFVPFRSVQNASDTILQKGTQKGKVPLTDSAVACDRPVGPVVLLLLSLLVSQCHNNNRLIFLILLSVLVSCVKNK